jgi:hypothetical protein
MGFTSFNLSYELKDVSQQSNNSSRYRKRGGGYEVVLNLRGELNDYRTQQRNKRRDPDLYRIQQAPARRHFRYALPLFCFIRIFV